MITRELSRELESALLRSYAHACRKVQSMSQREPNFLGSATYQENFVKAFMEEMNARKGIIEEHIEGGNYRNPKELADKTFQIVERKVRAELASKMLNRQEFDEAAFNRLIWQWRTEISKIFY